jgi:hypothetical protein
MAHPCMIEHQVGCAPRTTYGPATKRNGGMPHLLGHGSCGNGAWNAPYSADYSDKWYIDNFYIPSTFSLQKPNQP